MNKIIISLFAFAISFSLMANAQVNSISVTAVEDKSVVDSAVQLDKVPVPVLQQDVSEINAGDNGMQSRKMLEAEQVRAKIQLQKDLETEEFKRIDQEEAIQLRDKAKIGEPKITAEDEAERLRDRIKDSADIVKDKAELLRERSEEEGQAIGERIKSRIEITKENAIRTISQIKNRVLYDKELTSEKAREIIEKVREERASFISRAKVLKVELQDRRKIEKEELQNKIQLLKDQKKQEVVMRIDNNLNNLNDRFMEKWSEALIKLDEWTIKIIDKIAVESADDKDVTNANASIDKAKSAMLSARTAIENQLGKTYPVVISTEENLKSDVSAVRARLNTDLKSIKDSIQEAHKSVVSALVEFNQIIKPVEIDNN